MVVAARNEADRIGATLDALRRAFPDAGVWVADDGSSDGTGDIARARGARVVGRRDAIGKGGNVSAAAHAALEGADGGRVVLLCDGDLGESADRLPALTAAVGVDCDLAVAVFARRVGGGVGAAVAFARWAIERRCGFRPTAPISGQRAMRAEVLRAVLPLARGYGAELGMTIDAVRAGYRVREIELHLSHRATGRTPSGFLHRARQLRDFVRAERDRR